MFTFTIMKLKINEILKTDITTLFLEDFPEVGGTYGDKCSICNNEYRVVIDYLLLNGASTRQVSAYCATYGVLEKSFKTYHNHKVNHTMAKTDAVMTPEVQTAKRTEAITRVRNMDLKGRLNEVEVAAFADVISGTKVPTVKEGLTAAQLRKDLDASERKSQFLKEFFKSTGKTPIKDGKVKRKIEVTPAKGLKVSQEVCSP